MICEIVCVQNHYNLVHRDDNTLIDDLAHDGIAYVAYFPLGGFSPTLSDSGHASAPRRCRWPWHPWHICKRISPQRRSSFPETT